MFLTELFEAIDKRHAAFCFGRMNPPTVGHGQLIDTVASASQGGDYFVFVSQTQDRKKNPLDYTTKIKFVKALFPQHAGHVVYDPELKTIMQVANWLYNKGYRSVTFVAGSDRLASFKELLTKYNGQEDGYKFDSINFVSSGDRDPDADGIAGVSASSAREAASQGNFEQFAQATGAGKLAQPLYDAVRKGMLLESWRTGESPEVHNSILHATMSAERQGKKVVKSIGGYFKVTDKNDPAPELIPNKEYLAKQLELNKQLKQLSSEENQVDPRVRHTREYHNSPECKALRARRDSLTKELKTLRATDKSYIELAECSGYIPKNKKEARDPRWSNALTVDVHPDTPNKNMKALGLI